MTPFEFIIGSLAIWRLSYGMVKEDGPLMVWTRLRARLASSQKRSGGLFDMISCVRCTSFWIGLVGALFVSGSIWTVLPYAFAFSGASALLDKLYAFTIVTRPTTNNKIRVGRSSTPEQRNNVVSDPNSAYGYTAIKASSLLDN